MFDKIGYKLIISNFMTKDEYKKLINKYMNKLNLLYITAKQHRFLNQRKLLKHDNKLKYEPALLDTYNDIVENCYNISML